MCSVVVSVLFNVNFVVVIVLYVVCVMCMVYDFENLFEIFSARVNCVCVFLLSVIVLFVCVYCVNNVL